MAPPPSRCPPEAARSGGCPAAGTAPSTTPSTWPPSPSSGSATAPAPATTTARSPTARPPKKRCAPSSAASVTRSGPPWSPTPGAPPPQPGRHRTRRAREGNRGTTLSPARPAHTPRHRLFGQATPEPDRRLRPPSLARDACRRRRRREPEEPLDKQRGLDLARLADGPALRVGRALD